MRRAALLLTAAITAALAVAPGAQAKTKHWGFSTSHHYGDSRAARITDGDFFSGKIKYIDQFGTHSRKRFRNRRHGQRKRVYLVRGTVAIRNKDGYNVLGVGCRQSTNKGSFMLSTTNGTRAFYPHEAEHLEQHTSEGSVGLALGPFSVSLPFPAFQYWASTSTAPNVKWSSLSSRVHNWSWSWDDGRPNDVLLSWAAYWAGPAKGFRYKTKCTVYTLHDKTHISRATLKVTHGA